MSSRPRTGSSTSGPEGGDGGGTIVATGTPEEICGATSTRYTGQLPAADLWNGAAATRPREAAPDAERADPEQCREHRVALCSFSGGKDSCLALWRAQQQGLDVRTLLVMFEESGERSRSHAIPLPLIERQAQALQLDLVTRNASWQTYEAVFIAALRELRAGGHEVAVFGDIDLQAHRDWEEKVCAAAGVRAVLPLWHRDRQRAGPGGARRRLSRASSYASTRAICGDEFCGRQYDASFIA